ncbi:L,D-transpeptidase family protein [Aporhodopirellula aestuarii]|uniref:LysM peptidoglycan-binding domain-containing protein n=1 Tax=Aporhodopirellula aestuarii TaxID=2950107 RepID=A0ABT0U2A7_9BACT|nr:L,D-transpeptidase family protein [Aporhodopirellula aestuarii]MCM2371024.1 LysM peptidoglycan-binding domain-containing protein [Aporhodopirellula aestuarii]
MQTLKTSAIVVLMMTVLYGAYVSMTTPPDPLPQGVESLLVESGMDSLPDDFGSFGIDDGTPTGFEDFDMPGQADQADTSLASASGPSMDFNSIDQTYADLESNLDPAAADYQTESFQMSDLDPPATSTRNGGRLPEVDDSSMGIAISPEPGREYPSTGADFNLPDPNVAIRMADHSLSSPMTTATDSLGSFELPGGPDRSREMPGANSAASEVAAAGLANAIATADRQFAEDRRREALATLSLFYETPNLTSEQREQLLVRLDPLARDVIYSAEHLLEQPHRVGPNETLMDIAQKYDVPWQLLANINGVSDPVTVLPGTDLKVVRGPFRADVDLDNKELTLFLGDLYAGRFPVGIGNDPEPRPGTYTIQEKKSAKTYYDMAGTPIPPGSPRNPYGSMWIDLGQGISLHGSPKSDSATNEGCISIAGNYSRDVFGILSEGSSVTIR